MRQLALLCFLCLLAISGCRQDADQSAVAISTAAPKRQPAADLEAASAIANSFLEAWQHGDFAAMYDLLTFRNRELTSFDKFRTLYQNAHATISLESLTFRPHALSGEGRVLDFKYDVTFKSRILGKFSDNDRLLHLVIDPQADGWRIAWSPGNIFAEMGQGARLVLEEQVPSRANIYDRYGKVLADQNGRVVRVLVDNRHIPDRDTCYHSLARASGKSVEFFRDLFDVRSGPDWIVDAGILEATDYIETSDRLKADCSAEFRQRSTRRYLNGTLLPHVVGNVGYPDAEQVPELEAIGFNAETIIGKAAIEASMNRTLAGQPGGRLSLVGADGRRIRVLSEVRSRIPESLWLTIDADLQAAVLRLLQSAYEKGSWAEDSPGAAVVIMDVRNGEILALVSHPAFDANILNPFPSMGRAAADEALEALAEDERLPMLNRATQGAYPTGSVMKGMTSVAALESGVYDEDTRYHCTGSWAYGADIRYDWLLGGHGVMSVQTGITNSCNPFFYEAGFRLNAKDPWLLPAYALKLGLGQSSGLNQIPEIAGNVPTPDNIAQFTGLPWSYAHAVNLSIGQGEVLATPLQMLRLYATIANGGYLLRPHLVRERGILDQRTRVAERDVMLDTGLDTANLAIIRRGLCDVTSSYTGTAAHQFTNSPLQDVGVCGKTGTAQVPGDDKRPHSWFIAYAPAAEPQIAIVTMVENAGEGSSVAAPLTREILEYYYFGAV
ncbi:MAG: penicillin-binding transpeptidase domain-containing protein [Chloroflexi bacterium]|nr:penicillin-binding transpeptidase domain-containing protein [Chloroflexota bacterium]